MQQFKKIEEYIAFLPKPLAVVCHDAGSANIIKYWFQDNSEGVQFFLYGPAKNIWGLSTSQVFFDVELNLDNFGCLVSGTSWASSVEHIARIQASLLGIKSIAVLDHWVNYLSRFEKNGFARLPDELWVADDVAYKIAKETFPSVEVHSFTNMYLNAQVSKVAKPPQNGTLLYTLEPVRNTWGKNSPGEFQALDYALKNLDKLSSSKINRIILRLHPSEPVEKYSDYITKDSRIIIDSSHDLSGALSQSDLVVGVESFALVVALAAGRPVFSSLPPWAPAIRLPQREIKQIRYLQSV
jgi:hypothetical protein